MTVIILINVSPGLRGHLTRWMVEVSAGVFVGRVNIRIREYLWKIVSNRCGDGQAVLIQAVKNEQGWDMRTAGKDRWVPIDFDGLILSARNRN